MSSEYGNRKIPLSYLDDTEDNYCEFCQTRLERSSTSVPYGNTYYSITEYFCPNCG